MAQGRITESELSNGTIAPSAPPPRFDGSSASGSPPGYDAVLANDPEARRMATEFRSRGFTESLAHAGIKAEGIDVILSQVSDYHLAKCLFQFCSSRSFCW